MKKRATVGTAMAKVLNFVFQFPPIHGVFDTGYGVVYVFGELHESEIEKGRSRKMMLSGWS